MLSTAKLFTHPKGTHWHGNTAELIDKHACLYQSWNDSLQSRGIR